MHRTSKLCVGVTTGLTALLFTSCVNSFHRLGTGQRCDVKGFAFSKSEHIIVDLKVSFRVRSIEGTIKSQAGDWPENTFVTVQFRSRSGTGETLSTMTDANGMFRMPDLAAGEYCFKAHVDGWQTVLGVVVVSTTANRSNRIIFELPLGV